MSFLTTLSQRHAFHLVDPSAMPLLSSISALTLTTGSVLYFHGYSSIFHTTVLVFMSLLGFVPVCLFFTSAIFCLSNGSLLVLFTVTLVLNAAKKRSVNNTTVNNQFIRARTLSVNKNKYVDYQISESLAHCIAQIATTSFVENGKSIYLMNFDH